MSATVIAAIIAGGVTLIVTVVTQFVSNNQTRKALIEQREQLGRTLAEQRTRTLNERFATAAGQLGADKPPSVRLAGVYAMAGLADDWPENQQTCVDVLCGYLRMPYEPDPVERAHEMKRLDFRASREVRRSAIRVITAHLKDGAPVSWQGRNLDFKGAVFDGGDFSHARFSGGTVDFSDARFSGGTVDFTHTEFSGGTVDFNGARFFGGTVDFSDARFSGGTVDFTYTEFSGGAVSFSNAKFSGIAVNFSNAKFSGGMLDFSFAKFSGSGVAFGSAEFADGLVSFGHAKFSSGAVDFGAAFTGSRVGFRSAQFEGSTVSFNQARFSGGTVEFNGAVFSGSDFDFGFAEFSGGMLDFTDGQFSGGTLDFSLAGFSGSEVGFGGWKDGINHSATFSGGTLDFSGASWSHPPQFPWTGTPPRGVILPEENKS